MAALAVTSLAVLVCVLAALGSPSVNRSRRDAVAVVLACLGLAIPGASAAGGPRGAGAQGSAAGGWTVDASLYFWLPEVEGAVAVAGVKPEVDIGIGDIAHLFSAGDVFGGMAHLEARRECLTLILDVMGGHLSTDEVGRLVAPSFPTVAGVEAVGELEVVEIAGAYDVLEWTAGGRRLRGSLSLVAGGRYQHLEAGGGIPAGTVQVHVEETEDWVDPFVGARCELPVRADLSVGLRGDVGGFGVGSDLAWSVAGEIRYHLPFAWSWASPWLAAGYKVLDFDHRGSPGEVHDLQLRGPIVVLGLGF